MTGRKSGQLDVGRSNPHEDSESERAGTLAVVLGALALAATVFTYALSLSESFNPPGWVRAVGLVWLPIGFFGTGFAYAAARKGAGRRRGAQGSSLQASDSRLSWFSCSLPDDCFH